jgi:hypothetical protein
MTKYAEKSFTVSRSSQDPATCKHGWQRVLSRDPLVQECVLCGTRIGEREPQEATR